MKIIEPKVKGGFPGEPIQQHIELVCECAQISYRSEPKKGDDALAFYKGLMQKGHMSPLRHESRYFCVREETLPDCFKPWTDNPFVNYMSGPGGHFFSTNQQFVMEYFGKLRRVDRLFDTGKIILYEIGVSEMKACCPELVRFTMFVTTQISTSRELNRKSPNAITESSTRYILFDENNGRIEPSIVRPHWMTDDETVNMVNHGNLSIIKNEIDDATYEYIRGCEDGFDRYAKLIELGMPKEDARGVLPLDTTTYVAYTYSVLEWRDIINLRYWGTTGRPHPNTKLIVGKIKSILESFGYKFPNPKDNEQV